MFVALLFRKFLKKTEACWSDLVIGGVLSAKHVNLIDVITIFSEAMSVLRVVSEIVVLRLCFRCVVKRNALQ